MWTRVWDRIQSFCLFGQIRVVFSAMERVVFKTRSFAAADERDVEQHVRMTPQERWRMARALRDRLHPNSKDVRECHKTG